MRQVHVIGAGLAGLSAALHLASRCSARIVVHEASPAAGGRCRSFFDPTLNLLIDNGNHLLLSGNDDTFSFLKMIGSENTLFGPSEPCFPFFDRQSHRHWTIRPSRGRIPWWIARKSRRVPGASTWDHLKLLRLTKCRDDRTVAEVADDNPLFHYLVEPLSIAALNTDPATGSARLLGAVFRETLIKGGHACLPRFPLSGLSDALIIPALRKLTEKGATVCLNERITALTIEEGRVTAITTRGKVIRLGKEDSVILAVPPWIAADLLPGLPAPDQFESIINVHFKISYSPAEDLAKTRFLGVVGGTAEWIFIKPDNISVTISAANRLSGVTSDSVADACWSDIQAALNVSSPRPEYRVLTEHRATFAATAEQDIRRPGAHIGLQNLVVAGDWTKTGLPATIEGSIRSGRIAAQTLLDAYPGSPP